MKIPTLDWKNKGRDVGVVVGVLMAIALALGALLKHAPPPPAPPVYVLDEAGVAHHVSGSYPSGGQATVTLVNGLNSNVATQGLSSLRIVGPTGAFSVGGFTAGSAGNVLVVVNTTSQPMTIVNADSGSTSAWRINTYTGSNVTMQPKSGSVSLVYDGQNAVWVLQNTGASSPQVFNVRDYGAAGDGTTDDTAAVMAAVAAAGVTGGEVLLTAPGRYRLTGTVNLNNPLTLKMQRGALFVPNAPDGSPTGHVAFVSINSSDVTLDGVSFDYSGQATHTENTRYLIWAAGANNASHIRRVTIRNSNLTNFLVGAYVPPSVSSPSLNVGHGIFVTWVDDLLVEDNFVDQVSGFGIFTEACNHPTIRNNTVQDTYWAGITFNSGGFGGLVEGNRVLSTQGASFHAFDEGGMLNSPGTPSDGFGGNYRLTIRNNYCNGYVEYGEAIRIASTSYVDIDSNVLDQVWGTSYSGPTACISLSTRGSQNDSTHQVRVRGNICIAPPLSELYEGSSGTGMIGVYAQNPTSGAGSGRSDSIIVSDNQFLSPSVTAAAVSTSAADAGSCAAHVTNGSNAVTFAEPQAFAVGDALIFGNYTGVVYFVATVVGDAGTSYTLTANFAGTNNACTTAQWISAPAFFTQAVLVHGNDGGWDNIDIHDNMGTGWCMGTAIAAGFANVIAGSSTVTHVEIHHNTFVRAAAFPNDGNQFGVYLGAQLSYGGVDHNAISTWNTPIGVGGTPAGNNIVQQNDAIGANGFIDTGDNGFEIRSNNGTKNVVFNNNGKTTFNYNQVGGGTNGAWIAQSSSNSHYLTVDNTGVAFYGTTTVAQASRVGQLTDGVGTPSGTIADVGSSFSQTTLNNNFASIVTKLNALELANHNIGLTQ